MTQDRPLLGIALMLGFCIVAPMGDAVAKLLSASVPVGQVLLIRFAIQVAVLLPLVWLSGRAWRMRGRVLWLTALRTVLHVLGIAAMFAALRFLPLADAVAIVFVMPFMMLVLGKLALRETIGPARFWGCVVGFLGTLLVIQPSFVAVGWPALLPVFVAANFSVFMLVTRQIAKETDPIGLQVVSGAMAVAMLTPLILLADLWEIGALSLLRPDALQWGLLIGIGLLGTLGHLLMTWSLRFAPSATLAPMQYLEIPFATLLGLLVFGELPNATALLGIALTVAAGLFIILRERAIALRPAAPAPAPVQA